MAFLSHGRMHDKKVAIGAAGAAGACSGENQVRVWAKSTETRRASTLQATKHAQNQFERGTRTRGEAPAEEPGRHRQTMP
jgi:hypothetical protein